MVSCLVLSCGLDLGTLVIFKKEKRNFKVNMEFKISKSFIDSPQYKVIKHYLKMERAKARAKGKGAQSTKKQHSKIPVPVSVAPVCTLTNKEKYSEVLTPSWLVQEICDKFIRDDLVKKYNIKKIFEPGSGKGVFYDVAQNQYNLFSNHCTCFHYVMNDINEDYLPLLQNIVHESCKHNVEVSMGNVLQMDLGEHKNSFDLVWGNLPFNTNHRKFVPGLSKTNKLSSTQLGLSESRTLWTSITHKAFDEILAYGGLYCCIIPIIWLKEDRAKIYDLFVKNNRILFLKIYDSLEANKIFSYNCQTPVCYVCVQKINPLDASLVTPHSCFDYYDKIVKDYVKFHVVGGAGSGAGGALCIPTHYAKYFDYHVQYFNEKFGKGGDGLNHLGHKIIKINTMKPDIMKNKVFDVPAGTYWKHNKEQCVGFNDDHGVLGLNGFVSTLPGPHYGVKKLILPHKRLAKFVKDYDGKYGVYGRDMYVFHCCCDEEVDFLYDYFQLDFVQTMINDGFKVRMNFIEKHVFNYFPYLYGEDKDFLMQDYVDKMKDIYY